VWQHLTDGERERENTCGNCPPFSAAHAALSWSDGPTCEHPPVTP